MYKVAITAYIMNIPNKATNMTNTTPQQQANHDYWLAQANANHEAKRVDLKKVFLGIFGASVLAIGSSAIQKMAAPASVAVTEAPAQVKVVRQADNTPGYTESDKRFLTAQCLVSARAASATGKVQYDGKPYFSVIDGDLIMSRNIKAENAFGVMMPHMIQCAHNADGTFTVDEIN